MGGRLSEEVEAAVVKVGGGELNVGRYCMTAAVRPLLTSLRAPRLQPEGPGRTNYPSCLLGPVGGAIS